MNPNGQKASSEENLFQSVQTQTLVGDISTAPSSTSVTKFGTAETPLPSRKFVKASKIRDSIKRPRKNESFVDKDANENSTKGNKDSFSTTEKIFCCLCFHDPDQNDEEWKGVYFENAKIIESDSNVTLFTPLDNDNNLFKEKITRFTFPTIKESPEEDIPGCSKDFELPNIERAITKH